MVIGLSTFQRFFADYTDDYILIGGSACDINLAQQELAFRATRDLDIVLCIETRDSQFINTFWDFIRAGKYAIGEKSSGRKQFYRFKDPATPDFPYMLELFSRRPDMLNISDDSLLTPIPADDETSSLSAILLSDDYYEFIHDNRSIIDGLSVVSPAALIVLKAKAWMDLSTRKSQGEKIDQKNINKHKNDIARLVPVVPSEKLDIPSSIQKEMHMFLSRYAEEQIDAKALRLPLSSNEVKSVLSSILSG
jgi:hypothetical protein